MAPTTDVDTRAVGHHAARVIWLDSSVRTSYDRLLAAAVCDVDLIVFDTTCFWRDSGKIGRAVRRSLRAGVPIVLVRSHAKLDNLGVEYGRLGSLVLVIPASATAKRLKQADSLIPRMHDAVRLLGAAPTLANFPPFEHGSDYLNCSALRTASILRNTRGMARGLLSRWRNAKLTTFQHGLYLTLSAFDNATVDEIREVADGLAIDLTAQGLPVRHAGSFGFDFVAVEAYSDPVDARGVLRICGGDIPLDLSEKIGHRIAAWGRGLRS